MYPLEDKVEGDRLNSNLSSLYPVHTPEPVPSNRQDLQRVAGSGSFFHRPLAHSKHCDIPLSVQIQLPIVCGDTCIDKYGVPGCFVRAVQWPPKRLPL